MNPTPDVSIILPTYNESQNIADLIRAIHAAIERPHEILVLDDNSPDETWRIAEETGATLDCVKVIRRMKDRGLTKSIQHGIDVATGKYIVWMDCDFSMPPEDIPRLIAELDNGYDLAIGSRFVKGGKQKTSEDEGDSFLAIVLSSLGSILMSVLLTPSIRDYTSGFMCIRRNVFDSLRLRGDYGEYCIDLLFRAKLLGFKIKEIPYVCEKRRAGASKTAPNMRLLLKRVRQYLAQISRLQVVRFKHLIGKNISDVPAR